MQYLLTQSEMNRLVDVKYKDKARELSKLLSIALICPCYTKHTPWYCDKCRIKDMCTLSKNYSK